MQCPRCRASLPEVAAFCHACGQDLRTPDESRRKSFAAKPDEPVTSLALVSTIMPRGAGNKPQTYRVALLVSVVVALTCAMFGAMPLALMVAAFAVPIVYIVYLYDVNLWEDEPLAVTLLAFVLTFALAVAWTLLWQWLRGPSIELVGIGVSEVLSWRGFLVEVLLAVVVGEVIRHVGPLLLASRPQFDDLMDGLTFGIISGVAYSAGETVVTQWPLMHIGFAGIGRVDAVQMASLIFLHGFVKPLLYGTAVGLACAEFSGLGRGYDGFTGRYLRGALVSLTSIFAYNSVVYLVRGLRNGALELGFDVVVGLIILAGLILLVRRALHLGLMEAALEAAARRDKAVGAHGIHGVCPACEMPTLGGAAFCSACGASLRTQSKRRQLAMVVTGAPAPAIDTKSAPAPEATAADAWFDQEESKA